MAITITAKLDSSGVRQGAAQVGDALEGMADKGVQSTDKLDQVAGELQDGLAELKGRTEALKDELSSMAASGANSLGRIENAAEEAGDAVDSISDGKSNALEAITAISTGYLALVDIAKKFVETGKKAVEVVNSLAEEGNPAAIELADSLGTVRAQLLDIAENPIFQQIFSDIADVINESVIPAIREIPGTVFEMVLMTQKQILSLKESLGLIPEGSVAMLETMQDVARNAYHIAEEVTKKNREERKRLEEVAKVDAELAKIQNARDAEAVKATLDQVKSEEELRDIIDDLTESMRTQASEGKLSDEQKEASLRKIAQAEERISQLRTESTESEKKSAEESVKINGDAAKERERIAQEESDAKDKLAKEELDKERRNIDERKRLVTGGNVKGAEQLLGSQTREQVRDAYAEQQGTNAALRANYESGGDQKEVEKARRRALGLARRQFDQGNANPEEVRAAQVELAGKAADSAVAQGKSSKETAQATKEAIAELAKTQNELEQVQAEMANMRSLMGGISRQGERRRAQVAGSRQ
jgi:hypothetical protein